MRLNIIFLIGFSLLYGNNIKELQQAKKQYKLQMKKTPFQKQQKFQKKEEVTIVFKQINQKILNLIEKEYELKVERCIAKNICIFSNHSSLKTKNIISQIKKSNLAIQNISLHKKYHFSRY